MYPKPEHPLGDLAVALIPAAIVFRQQRNIVAAVIAYVAPFATLRVVTYIATRNAFGTSAHMMSKAGVVAVLCVTFAVIGALWGPRL